MQIDSPQPWQQEFEHLKINDQEPTGSGGCDSDDSTYDSDDSMGSDYDEDKAETIRWRASFNRERSEKSKKPRISSNKSKRTRYAARVKSIGLLESGIRVLRIAEFPWPPDPNDCGPYEYISQYLKDVKFQEDELELAKKFLEQVKSSWGYDVDCYPPRWLPASYFRPIDVETMLLESPHFNNILNSAADSVISEINSAAEARKMGKKFELVRIIKSVFMGSGFKAVFLLTLAIKDVELDIEKTVRAMVSMPPIEEPKLVECKLISSGPA